MFVVYFVLAILLGVASMGFIWVASQESEEELTRNVAGVMVIILLLASFALVIAGFDSYHESAYYGL